MGQTCQDDTRTELSRPGEPGMPTPIQNQKELDFVIYQNVWSLESVEADMTELEIDKEDVHDRKKWRMTVMKRESNPIGKRTINR